MIEIRVPVEYVPREGKNGWIRLFMTSPEWTYSYLCGDERRTTVFEWLPPKVYQGKHAVRIRVDRAMVFSIAFVTYPGYAQRLRAILEPSTSPGAESPPLGPGMLAELGRWTPTAPEDLIVDLLGFDHSARCGDPQIVGGIAAAEFGLFCRRLAGLDAAKKAGAG